MTQRDYYTIALDLLDGSQQVWTAQEVAEKLDCTTQRACVILRRAELDGVVKSFTINNRHKWISSDNFLPITIDWLTKEEYFETLSIKEKILWIVLDFLKEWWYN